MIIRNKFNGYGFDGSRLCHDPVSLSIAATQAGAASSAAAAALAAKTAAATTAATTAATAAAGKTAALELAKKEAISAGMKQAGTEAAKQGIAQAGQQAGVEAAKQTGVEAMKQGIFSNPAGMPPTAGGPITPPTGPATPLAPAGNTPPVSPADMAARQAEMQAARENAARELAARGGNVKGTAAQSGQAFNTVPKPDPTASSWAQTGLPGDSAYTQTLNTTSPVANAPVVNAPVTTPTPPADPSLGGFSQNYMGAAESSKGLTTKGLDPNMLGQSGNVTQGVNVTPDMAAKFGTPPPQSALEKGFHDAMKFVGENKINTGLGLMAAGQYMNQPKYEEDKNKYKNTVDMSGFQPSIPKQPSFTRSYEYQNYQAGGPVEDMSRMNSIGANTGYPMAQLQTPAYSVSSATPMPVNTLSPTADASVNAYTGAAQFAEGGLSAAQRREYGLSTRGQRAARGLTASYEEMEEQRQREAMKLFNESSLPTPRPIARSRTQELSSPFSAAMTEHARLGKKSKVPVIPLPKTNLGDIDNYMDIPIDAANGGIMRSFSNGGPSFMGVSGSGSKQERQGPKFMGVSQSPTQAEADSTGGPTFMKRSGPGRAAAPTAPVMTAPKYTAPVQQAYTPISYQNSPSYQQPQPQQSDMSDFYSSMDQQLGNYGFAEGGIMHGLGGYSDGGRLLRGPGDGVSDSIPAVIGKRQPARLADGEFVIPARIVSELGNGSTEAGARKLYAMMERVQATRKKSIGKKKVAVNSKSDKHLPA